jgi:hypothetical protein
MALRWFSGSPASASSIFRASSPCNSFSGGAICDLSSYCRCAAWSSFSACVSSMDSAGWRERRRISFRHKIARDGEQPGGEFRRLFVAAAGFIDLEKNILRQILGLVSSRSERKMKFITGCLYLSTNSGKRRAVAALDAQHQDGIGIGWTGIARKV